MRRRIMFALLVLTVSALTFGQVTQAKTNHAPDAVQDVEARQRAYLEALHTHDMTAIGKFFADDYSYTGVDGQLMTKAQRLDNMKSNPPPTSLNFTALKVRVYGDTAVVTGHVTSAVGPNGQALNNQAMWVWSKRGGTWLLVAAQNTAIAPAK